MNRDDLMFRDNLLEGHRILVTGGGTGLGKVMAEAFLIWAPTYSSAGVVAACLIRRPMN